MPFLSKLEVALKSIRGRRIGLAGFGVEGRSTLAFLQRQGLGESVVVAENEREFDRLQGVEFVFRSPGIHPQKLMPWCSEATVLSQTSFALQVSPIEVIAVTGTKGKSTTSSALAHVLAASGKRVVYSGNVGIPHLDCLEAVQDADYWVMELSAQQLMDVRDAPDYALWLNLYPEHLDYFGQFDDYARAKACILGKNTKLAVVANQVETVCAHILSKCKNLYFYTPQQNSEFPALGVNCAGLEALCTELGVENEAFRFALKNFQPLPGRLQTVAEREGVIYVSDCLATVPEAVLYGLTRLPRVDYLILGGKDRGNDFKHFFSQLKNTFPRLCLAFMGEVAPRLETDLHASGGGHDFICCGTLVEAVAWVRARAQAGEVCLLAPGAPSYDQYVDYRAKQRHYEELLSI